MNYLKSLLALVVYTALIPVVGMLGVVFYAALTIKNFYKP